MKNLLLLLFVGTFTWSYGQTWNFIGSSTGENASEVDIEVAPDGTLYKAYINTDASNQITVRKWANHTWQLVGATSFGSNNCFDLQLVISTTGVPSVAAKTMYLTYEVIDTYTWSGTTWNYQGVGNPLWTEHNYDFSLQAVGASTLILTYYNRLQDFLQEDLITINLTTATQIGTTGFDQGNIGNAVASYASATNHIYVAHEENDMGDYLPLDFFNTTWDNVGYVSNSEGGNKIKITKGIINFGMIWDVNYSTRELKFVGHSGSANGTEITLATNTTSDIDEFDMEAVNDNHFVFYRSGTTCYFKKITGTMSPVQSTISFGTGLAPADAVSLKTEEGNGINIIAYVSGGKCLVKEKDSPANIEDFSSITMCEQSAFDNDGASILFNLDDNYSNSNVTMTCTSSNTAVIPNSAITISNDGLYYFIDIASTNDVTANTVVDLTWTLLENAVAVGTILMPVTVVANPTIAFQFPVSERCANTAPVHLTNKATPVGGSWSGAGVFNNFFSPMQAGAGEHYLVYTKTTNAGCVAVDSFLFTVHAIPSLVVTTFNASCEAADGRAGVAISGGQAPYSIYWSSGSIIDTAAGLPAGQYFVNVTDQNNCSASSPAMIGTSGVSISGSTNQVSCHGGNNGAINITVTGSGPFTYLWSNGATTEDVSGLIAGPYEVTVTDPNNCSTSASFTVTEPALIQANFSSTTATCGEADGSITASVTGGTAPYIYNWTDMLGNGAGTTAGLSDIGAGAYALQVTDAAGCTNTVTGFVLNNNPPTYALDTIIAAACSNNGAITLNMLAANTYTFQWSNGSTTQNQTGLAAGTYTVQILSAAGCIASGIFAVPAVGPPAVEICMVTVDTNTNTNLVVWEKPVVTTIDHFNIYRETSQAGLYQLVGSVPYADESVYNDLVASPTIRSWRYKISSVDLCGNESELSEIHKTIHLVMNLGLNGNINLSWDQYEGFAFAGYKIWRYNDALGWLEIQTMPVTLFTYTDIEPDPVGLVYLVSITPPDVCQATTRAQDFNSSRSNKGKAFAANPPVTNGLDLLEAAEVLIAPNPTTGLLTIRTPFTGTYQLEVYDVTGVLVQQKQCTDPQTTLDISGLAKGSYVVKLRTKDQLSISRIIKQ
jgi:hypothetical protein